MSENYYEDIYLKRLNRYGYDYQTRIQGQRERVFEDKLLKSVYRVDFEYDEELHPATLERYKQDETQLMQYLLTRVSLNLPNGTILMIPDKDDELQPWMVYWLESIKASGYNRYIILKMTHYITWRDRTKNEQSSWCYLHGSGDSALKDTLKTIGALYREDNNSRFIIMPTHEKIKKDDYFEIGEGDLKEAYRVTGYDVLSTPGVEYVTLNPMYIKDQSAPPTQQPGDNSDDLFWLTGGADNGST